MFVCDVCGSVALPGTPSHRIVVETREVDHPPRPDAHRRPRPPGGKIKWLDDPGGRGSQIVRELRACEPCAAKPLALDRQRASPRGRGSRAAPTSARCDTDEISYLAR